MDTKLVEYGGVQEGKKRTTGLESQETNPRTKAP